MSNVAFECVWPQTLIPWLTDLWWQRTAYLRILSLFFICPFWKILRLALHVAHTWPAVGLKKPCSKTKPWCTARWRIRPWGQASSPPGLHSVIPHLCLFCECVFDWTCLASWPREMMTQHHGLYNNQKPLMLRKAVLICVSCLIHSKHCAKSSALVFAQSLTFTLFV